MSDTEGQKPDRELAVMLIQSKFMYLRAAQCLIDVEPHVAGWSPEAIQGALAMKEAGARIVLEISGDGAGTATVVMVAVSPNGARRPLDRLAETPAGAVN
jgi:hypothetical protein